MAKAAGNSYFLHLRQGAPLLDSTVALLLVVITASVLVVRKLSTDDQPALDLQNQFDTNVAQVETKNNEVYSLFYKDRNYDTAIQQQEEALSLAKNVSVESELSAKSQLANLNLN